MRELNGKTAFVTGGASGIGLGIVRALLAEGVKVVAGDVREDHIRDAQAQLGPLDGLRFITTDGTDRASLARATAAVRDTFGDLHILCNNAAAGIIAGAKEATPDDWDWSIAVNLTGVFNGLHAFLPGMLAHGQGGHVVNTASIAAALPGNVVYAAAKCGVLGLSEGLRAELAPDGIGVTCLMPGPTASNIHQVAALRPARFSRTGVGAFEQDLAGRAPQESWLDPLSVGEMVVDAIRRDLMFAFTHKEHRDGVASRLAAMLAAFPPGDVAPDAAQRLGFRIANPMYEEMLARQEPPARRRNAG